MKAIVSQRPKQSHARPLANKNSAQVEAGKLDEQSKKKKLNWDLSSPVFTGATELPGSVRDVNHTQSIPTQSVQKGKADKA